MKCRVTGSIAIAMMLSMSGPQAQTKPNFAGQWRLVPDKTQLGGNGGCPGIFDARGLGQEFSAAHTSTMLAIERMQGPPANQTRTTFKYKLDGSESTNQVPLGGEAISTAAWNGQKLTIVTTSVFDTGGGDVRSVTMKTTQVLSLDSTGLLNVATTLGCRDHAPETSTVVYRKGT
jgi:hypothetical protein